MLMNEPFNDLFSVAKSFVKANQQLLMIYDEQTGEIILQSENFTLKQPARGVVSGAGFIVDARKTHQIISSLSSPSITTEVLGNWVTLSNGQSRYKIQKLSARKPIHVEKSFDSNFSLRPEDIRVLEGMSRCANQHDFRQAMQSVIIESRDNYLSFITTNGHVLVVGERENTGSVFTSPLVMPKHLPSGMNRMIGDRDELNVHMNPNIIKLESGTMSAYLSRLSTAVPNWRPFLRLPYECMGLAPEQLQRHCKLAMSVVDKGETQNKLTIPVRMTSIQETLVLELTSDIKHFDELLRAKIDSSKTTSSIIDIEAPGLSEFTLVINPIYLNEALTHLESQSKGGEIAIHINRNEQLLRLQSDQNLNYFIKVRLKR
ncbi:hypothetical protein VroAM7_49480 (plasmid) [Vibrio rotiferianus]|uniref:Beta sliding clamp n=1 Tax=Vibrio rotiferianus TaxID=190895 RepID=A0A510IES1_9VIBR|nr:hypothetical protein [Vibrio rotiferianus]BBL92295.1 hypothetical protein VroAM7_49480 [Vibrio rotiferianus]